MRYHARSPLTQSIEKLKCVVRGNDARSSVTNGEYTTPPKLSLEDINTLHMLDPTSYKTRRSFVKFKNEVQVNDEAGEDDTNGAHARIPFPQGTDFSTYSHGPTYMFHDTGNNDDVNTNNTYKHARGNSMDDDTVWAPQCQFVSDAMASSPDELSNMIRRGRPPRELPTRGAFRRVGEYTNHPPPSRSNTLPLRSIMRRINEYPKPRTHSSTGTSWQPKMWPLRTKRDPQSTNYKRCMSRYMENAVNDRGRDRPATEERAIRFSDCISEDDGDDDKSEPCEEGDAMVRDASYESGVRDDASDNTSNSNQSVSSSENVTGSTGRSLREGVVDRMSSRKAIARHSLGSRIYSPADHHTFEDIYADERLDDVILSADAQHRPTKNLSERRSGSDRRVSGLQRSRYDIHHSGDRHDAHGKTNTVVSSDGRQGMSQRSSNGPRSRSTSDDMLTLQRAKGKFLRYQEHKSRHPSPDKVSSLDRVYGGLRQLSTYFETVKDQSIASTDASEAESDAATVLENVYYRNSAGVQHRTPASTPDIGHVVAVKARAPGHNQIELRRARSTGSNSMQPRRHKTKVPVEISSEPIHKPYELSSESDPLLDSGCAEYVDGIPLVCESDIFVEEAKGTDLLGHVEGHDTLYQEALPTTTNYNKRKSDVNRYATLNSDNLARMNNETVASVSNEIAVSFRERNTSPGRRTGRESSATRHQAKSPTRKATAPEQKSTSVVNAHQRRDATSNVRVRSGRPNRPSPVEQTNKAQPVYGKYSFSHVLCEKPPPEKPAPANTDSNRRLSGDQVGTSRVTGSRRVMPPNAPATDSKPTTVTRNASDSRQVPKRKNHPTTCNSASEDIQTCSRSSSKQHNSVEPIQRGSDISNDDWPASQVAAKVISETGNEMDATTATEVSMISSMESEEPASSSQGNSDTPCSVNDGSSGNGCSKSASVVDNACQPAAGDQDTLDALDTKKIPGGW